MSVLPSGAPAQEASFGSFGKGIRHAISDDGSRVFWMGLSENPNHEVFQHLFMRDTNSPKTIQIDAAQGVAEPSEEPEPEQQEFQTASASGERVFFTYPLALTRESLLAKEAVFLEEGSDLYVCELPGEAEKCQLTDLTVGRLWRKCRRAGRAGRKRSRRLRLLCRQRGADPRGLVRRRAPRRLRRRTDRGGDLQPLPRPLRQLG